MVVPCFALAMACSDNSDATGAGGKSEEAATGPQPTASDCDVEKVAALSKGLETADARTRRDTVATQLAQACKLPDVVTDYIALAASPESSKVGSSKVGSSKVGSPHGVPEEAHATASEQQAKATRAVCTGAAIVLKRAESAPAGDRAGMLYDGCKLDRFGLIGRGEYSRLGTLSTVAFYTQKWMTDQGVPKEQAQSIARALLLLERVDFSRDGIAVPTLAHALGPVGHGTLVHVGPNAIDVNGKQVVALKDGKAVELAADEVLGTAPLLDALSRKEQGEAGANNRVLLVADSAAPFTAVAMVLDTAAQAGVAEVAFLAETAPLEYGTVPVMRRKTAFGGGPDQTLSVVVDDKGFSLRFGAQPSTRIDGNAEQPWNFEGLADYTTKFMAGHDTVTHASVVPVGGIPYAAVVQAVAILRGPECESAGACLLPNVSVGAASGDLGAIETRTRILGHSALLGSLSDDSAMFGSLSGSADVWGGLTGAEVGEAFGAGGLGLSGGGGGTGEGTIGLGNVGLIGKGSSGHGTGHGSGATKVPKVRASKATVKGSLDKEIIRRIVRAHINEVRYCYNKALSKDPALEGRVKVKFTIAATGAVTAAEVADSTVGDESVGTCIAKAAKRWKFPKPIGGGIVVVTYPFVLSAG